RVDRFCELNVMAQVSNVCKTKPVQRAWKAGRELTIHGWIYSIEDGVIKDLKVDADDFDSMPELYWVE
ncbi:MAG: carbonic anhydrase, partial [Oceanospirillaceae bacterium]|nr:carbonic anhydrase [Oceanospirillaceae bacterium]